MSRLLCLTELLRRAACNKGRGLGYPILGAQGDRRYVLALEGPLPPGSGGPQFRPAGVTVPVQLGPDVAGGGVRGRGRPPAPRAPHPPQGPAPARPRRSGATAPRTTSASPAAGGRAQTGAGGGAAR